MSTEYQAIAIYGISFHKHAEAEAWLKAQGVEIDDLYEFDEMYLDRLSCEALNAYSGNNVAIGFPFELGKPLHFYQELWNEQFGDVSPAPTAFLDIKVY